MLSFQQPYIQREPTDWNQFVWFFSFRPETTPFTMSHRANQKRNTKFLTQSKLTSSAWKKEQQNEKKTRIQSALNLGYSGIYLLTMNMQITLLVIEPTEQPFLLTTV